MRVRKLNQAGVNEFAEYLRRAKSELTLQPPFDLLDRSDTSEPASAEAVLDTKEVERVTTKGEAARYLDKLLDPLDSYERQHDAGLWAWLGLAFFDQLCPPDRAGKRELKKRVNYLPDAADFRIGLNKHFLYFPWRMYRVHGDVVSFFLEEPLPLDSRNQREQTNIDRLNTCPSVVRLWRRLYWNEEKGKAKRGAHGQEINGTTRYYGKFMNMLDVTYDLGGMSVDELLELMPPKIRRWASQS